MPTRAAEQSPGVGTAAKQVAEHAGTLAKLNLELARLELKHKAGAVGFGIALDAWLALLLVTVGLLAIAGILGLIARARLKGGGSRRDDGDR
jgi:uncharacterized membrane protein YqjE